MNWTRRSVLTGAAAMGSTLIVRPALAAEYKFSQYHNQAASGPLHKNLTAMWEAVRTETNGRVETTVYAENNKLPGGDRDALKMLIAGEIAFFTLMGGIIGTVVPVAEAQQLPFAFASAAEAHKAIDGPLGKYIGEEMAAKGMHLFPVAGFDNGMRQVASISRPIAGPQDFTGMKIRVPPGQMMIDTFSAFGAEPVTTSANQIYDALKLGKVKAQENPLAILEGFKLYELVKYVSMTNHMWSGFNAMAHRATWNALPADIREVIERNFTKYVRLQRQDQAAFNAARGFRQARAGVQRGQPGRVPRQAPGRLCDLEREARHQMLVAGRGRSRQARLNQPRNTGAVTQRRRAATATALRGGASARCTAQRRERRRSAIPNPRRW
jgi:tripartite ATP-independent transporter DctP family solute receptor